MYFTHDNTNKSDCDFHLIMHVPALALHTEHISVDEVHQAVILEQVVLNGRARQQHSSLRLQSVQGCVRLVVRVLQAVPLTDYK